VELQSPERNDRSCARPQPPNRRRRWLFHGTSEAVATSIISSGWHPPDPRRAVEEFAADHDVEPADLSPGLVQLGIERHARSEASCATGWGLSAPYARRGPEVLLWPRRALAKIRSGRDEEPQLAPPTERAAIFLIRIPWNLVEELNPGQERDAFLPDSAEWDELDLGDRLTRVPHEVLVPGSLLVEHLRAVDWIRTDCDCSGSFHLVLGAENDVPDKRLRCERCFIAEELILESSPHLPRQVRQSSEGSMATELRNRSREIVEG
jgi:hypothetical protein